MNRPLRNLLLPLVVLTAGCTTDGAVFVTKTSLSIADLDATPPEATLGMHRIEGFIAPRNRNGNTPPVLAHLQSNRDFFTPNVQQVYATGTAAERLADDFKSENSECKNCSEKSEGRPITFATSTSIGLRIGLGSSVTSPIEGVMLGFRRKEMSYVPALAKDDEGNYRYPSLIAAIRLGGPSNDNPRGFSSCQGFATGTAANALAKDDAGFGCLEGNETVKHMLTSKYGLEQRQQAEIAKTLQCYAVLPQGERRTSVHTHAAHIGLLGEPAGATLKGGGGFRPVAADDIRPKTYGLSEADLAYTGRLLQAVLSPGAQRDAAGTTQTTGAAVRAHLLRIHREYVCGKPGDTAAQAQAPAQ
jgi:hypothetical protein